ncbi:MAG: M23 family metallopeptidase [Desulfobulbaceae bacterium]|nr:M23 family metallopeptidase [Desulfobulbaceae bacterium]
MQALKKFIYSIHCLTVAIFALLCLFLFSNLPKTAGNDHQLLSEVSARNGNGANHTERDHTALTALLKAGYNEIHGTIQRGDTLARSFEKHDVPSLARLQFIQAFKSKVDFTNLHPGEQYSIIHDQNDQIVKSVYRVNPYTSYTALPAGNGFKVVRDEVQLQVKTVAISGEVRSSLFAAFPDDVKSPRLVYAFADIFASKMDFNTETMPGDRINLVVEEYYRLNEFIGYGNILAARYKKVSGEIFEAFYHAPDNTNFYYFDSTGNELGSSFIRSPVPIGRVSSSFSYNRLHPILGIVRPHLGVDLAAPSGTPVMASADGRIISMGNNGGFGKLIVIAHGNDFRTYYGHLGGYNENLHVGSLVRQKQTIGYVGATGLATGPHLDYRLQYRGVFKNPFAIKFQPRSSLQGKQLENLRQSIGALMRNLSNDKGENLIEVKAFNLVGNQKLTLL